MAERTIKGSYKRDHESSIISSKPYREYAKPMLEHDGEAENFIRAMCNEKGFIDLVVWRPLLENPKNHASDVRDRAEKRYGLSQDEMERAEQLAQEFINNYDNQPAGENKPKEIRQFMIARREGGLPIKPS